VVPYTVKPLNTMNVRFRFDRCQPDQEKVFGWTSSGFLAIPEDGVYTFHAPAFLNPNPLNLTRYGSHWKVLNQNK
jgi:hypothetical protein